MHNFVIVAESVDRWSYVDVVARDLIERAVLELLPAHAHVMVGLHR